MILVPRVLLVLPALLVLMEVTGKTERLVRRVLLEIQVAPLDQRAIRVLPVQLVQLVLPVLTVLKV